MLLGGKYRKYSRLGGSTKIKLETRDNLTVAEIREVLESAFGIQLTLEDMKNGGFLDSVDTKSVDGEYFSERLYWLLF